MKDYREMLFQMTLIVNAIRYFKGDIIGACIGSRIGHHTLTDVPGYFGVVLNPLLGDMQPPYPPNDSSMYNRVTIYDRAGHSVRDEHLYSDGSRHISEQDALWWWEWIREYVLVNESPFPRLVTMARHYTDYINDIEEKWQAANN